MKTLRRTCLIGLLALCPRALLAADWPGWRGDGSGISPETNLPVRWDATTNVAWKTPLPGKGNSSPTVSQGRVFLSAWDDDGKKRSVLCLDTRDGKILWERALVAPRVEKTNPKNGYASSTLAADGRRVYAFFDSPGLVALDLDGKVLWTRDLGPFKTDWGIASSPLLYKDRVVQCCDHDGESFITALDAATGEVRWRTVRPDPRQYATPLLIAHDGKPQIVVNGMTVCAYDPDTGEELWRCRGMNHLCSPSAVYADGGSQGQLGSLPAAGKLRRLAASRLVYVASGRNGPAMAIDPGGRGDVTETHVRWFLPLGGPYVVSPIVCPLPCLPGDNGALRFVGPGGNVVLEGRLGGHFTASPVGAAGRMYWTNERGITYVVDVSRVAGAPPALEVLAANPLDERVYASPAVANGRLYIRTAKNLFCIAGAGEPEPPAVAGEAGRTFAELKKQYEAHPAPVGDEVIYRIEAVEALASVKGQETIELLARAALEDAHWDVSEAAAKALGAHGEAALPAVIKMFGSSRPYLRIIAATHLGEWRAVGGIATLVKGGKDRDALVRIHALRSLAQIAAAHAAEAPQIVAALAEGLRDREGVVRQAAIEALASVADKTAAARDSIVRDLLNRAADVNPLVRQTALGALSEAFRVPEEVVGRDPKLFGEQRGDPVIAHLVAGPIRAKFQDGELRYLRVGDKEIVRRVYFAVRDKHWNTALPQFTRMEVEKREGGFRVRLSAVCRNAFADYQWDGEMEGRPDGRISFRANGRANADFESPRIGICLLFGSASLAGQAFEVVDKAGKVSAGEFPRLVLWPLVAKEFRSLSYATPEGMQVIATFTGNPADMEDQRNFGDSSYKVFSPIPHEYPGIKKGGQASHVLTVQVKNAQPKAVAGGPVEVTLGKVVEGARVPKVQWGDQPKETPSFWWVNHPQQREKLKGADLISWHLTPAVHLCDDDTLVENLPTVVDQVATVRSFAPQAKIRVGPVSIDFKGTAPGSDPRNRALFGAAWSAALIKHLALAGVDEAVFRVGPARIQEEMAGFAGRQVVATSVSAPLPRPVEALAVQGEDGRVLWLINQTEQRQKVSVDGTPVKDLEPFEVRKLSP